MHYIFVIMQIAKNIVSKFFTYGSLLDTSAVLVRVLQAPELREIVEIAGKKQDNTPKYWETVQAIVQNIEHYLTVILQTKGTRATVDERAYRTVLAACSGENLKTNRRVHQAGMILVCMYACLSHVLRMLLLLFTCACIYCFIVSGRKRS